jgi:hypothetical protein
MKLGSGPLLPFIISGCAEKKGTKPSTIFILADDLGSGDVGSWATNHKNT